MQKPLQVYRNEVWMLMHNSDDPERQTAAIRLYLDESGSGGDPLTPHAIVGGLIINRPRYDAFEEVWPDVLERHGIDPPLHMKEFGRPHGRFASVSDVCRQALFADVASVINKHKLFSISASLSNQEYQTHFPSEVTDIFSVYGMCFILAAMVNHKIAENHNHKERIPFILDSGNPNAEHVRMAHASMLKFQKDSFMHVGSLTFDEDENLGILQAADVVAWGARRKATKIPFGCGFSPVAEILKEENYHQENDWKSEWLQHLGQAWAHYVKELEAKSAEENL